MNKKKYFEQLGMDEQKHLHFIEHQGDGTIPCGYCWSKKHRGYLSVEILQRHQCLQKQCNCLQKYENHKFWKKREMRRLMKSAMKNGQSFYIFDGREIKIESYAEKMKHKKEKLASR